MGTLFGCATPSCLDGRRIVCCHSNFTLSVKCALKAREIINKSKDEDMPL